MTIFRQSITAFFLFLVFVPGGIATARGADAGASVMLFPGDKSVDVNPDTHLVITFPSAPKVGNSGLIRIYDAADNRVVDTLDMSIAAGPAVVARGVGGRRVPATGAGARAAFSYDYSRDHQLTNADTAAGTASGVPGVVAHDVQLNIIGGFTDGFHFYPVIVHDKTATIYPHNNLLKYGKTYYVQIDPTVLSLDDGSFKGIGGNGGWTFSTKKSGPTADSERVVVSGDGSGDFNTVQGAIDWIPDKNAKRVTIFIKNGTYEEIVYFRNKTNVTFLGEDQDKTVVQYRNAEAFNGAGANRTNEVPGTFPYRRAVFMADHCSGIQIVNLSLKNIWGMGSQAESLIFMGGENIACHVSLYGNTDTLQFNDSVYISDSYIQGGGDFLWGRGPAFFDQCDIVELGNNPMMWVRSTEASRGFVYLNCKFNTPKAIGNGPILARNTSMYPNSEVVILHCALGMINPVAWTIPGDKTNLHYWEYASTNLSDGKPADVSRRTEGSRQLTEEQDKETIANYSNPSWVLGNWTPAMAPLILTQPADATAAAGGPAVFSVKVGAIPAASYQWFKNGTAIDGATNATLKLDKVGGGDAEKYTVTATNSLGSATSDAVKLSLK
jgi:pectinesterase